MGIVTNLEPPGTERREPFVDEVARKYGQSYIMDEVKRMCEHEDCSLIFQGLCDFACRCFTGKWNAAREKLGLMDVRRPE